MSPWGDWPGDPDSPTVLARTMLVDYVRVCERQGSKDYCDGLFLHPSTAAVQRLH